MTCDLRASRCGGECGAGQINQASTSQTYAPNDTTVPRFEQWEAVGSLTDEARGRLARS